MDELLLQQHPNDLHVDKIQYFGQNTRYSVISKTNSCHDGQKHGVLCGRWHVNHTILRKMPKNETFSCMTWVVWVLNNHQLLYFWDHPLIRITESIITYLQYGKHYYISTIQQTLLHIKNMENIIIETFCHNRYNKVLKK